MDRSPRPAIALFLFVAAIVTANSVCQGQSAIRPSTIVSIKLTPVSATIGISANLQMKATVSGSTNRAVTWKVNGIVNGDSTYGTVDSSTQLYFAPATTPNPAKFTITATSVADTSKSASATIEVLAADPLGTVNSVKTIACPSGGVPGASCQEMAIACEGLKNFNAYIKVNAPTGASNGVVIYGVGTGGSGLYDSQFTYGQTAVENVVSAGFTTVQVSFGAPFTAAAPNGWLTGPGGVRRLACRYATLASWINTHVLSSSTKPLCATGNSGGSGAISYALSNYGLDRILSMVEITSGPPMSRIDYGCLCKQGSGATTCGRGQVNYCYGLADAAIIDTAYSQPLCSNAVNGKPSPIAAELFLSDSIASPGAVLAFPKTNVNVLYGGQDASAAVPLGLEWYDQINSKKGQSCVADAPHSIPDVLDGATQISNDLTTLCKLQP
jgi:hypothetical protein